MSRVSITVDLADGSEPYSPGPRQVEEVQILQYGGAKLYFQNGDEITVDRETGIAVAEEL